jgi:hypothetical protein
MTFLEARFFGLGRDSRPVADDQRIGGGPLCRTQSRAFRLRSRTALSGSSAIAPRSGRSACGTCLSPTRARRAAPVKEFAYIRCHESGTPRDGRSLANRQTRVLPRRACDHGRIGGAQCRWSRIGTTATSPKRSPDLSGITPAATDEASVRPTAMRYANASAPQSARKAGAPSDLSCITRRDTSKSRTPASRTSAVADPCGQDSAPHSLVAEQQPAPRVVVPAPFRSTRDCRLRSGCCSAGWSRNVATSKWRRRSGFSVTVCGA